MVQNSLLRANARKQLGGGLFKMPWLVVTAVVLIYSVIISVSTSTFGVSFFLIGPLNVGLYTVILNGIRQKKWEIPTMFIGFKNFLKTFVLYFLQSLYLLLWGFLVIPAIVKRYSYAMAYYIHIDNPELGANDCITISRKMMNGHKWQLFCLDCSFIGWYILGSLCFGLGIPFVDAYRMTAYSNFYLALKAEVSVR